MQSPKCKNCKCHVNFSDSMEQAISAFNYQYDQGNMINIFYIGNSKGTCLALFKANDKKCSKILHFINGLG